MGDTRENVTRHNLDDLETAHSAGWRNAADDQSIEVWVINEGNEADWHLVRGWAQEYMGEVHLELEVRPEEACDTEFYVNLWGGLTGLLMRPDGSIADKGVSSALSVEVLEDGWYRISVEFLNSHPSISFGIGHSDWGNQFQGRGLDQWQVRTFNVHNYPLPTVPGGIIVLDVGARGGPHDGWGVYGENVSHILVEPDPQEANRLRGRHVNVIDTALFNSEGQHTLYLTRHPGCSSLMRPNTDVLERYSVSPCFDVMGEVDVKTARFEDLYNRDTISQPDIVKIDVQGAELEVLEGFGDLLFGVVGIEAEMHFYPIYEGQKLIGDIVSFLDQYGFSLRKIDEQPSFDGDRVEFNGFFVRRAVDTAHPIEEFDLKKAFIEQHWHLSAHPVGAAMARDVLAITS